VSQLPNEVTEPMARAALDYLDELRSSYLINLNYYIDESVIIEIYRRMEAVRSGNYPPHNQ
jgi:hypothetical protein